MRFQAIITPSRHM